MSDWKPLDEQYDTQMDVEADPCGAHMTIQTLVAATPDDGRPCSTDEFLVKLLENCDDHFDRNDAIIRWLEGDWPGAMDYAR